MAGGRATGARAMTLVATASLFANLIIALAIGYENPSYFLDYTRNDNPDAQHYVLLGENFWSKGVYSRQSAPPYRPDILRTPIYPVLAGGLQVGFGAIWPVYLLQALLSTGTALCIYVLTARAFGTLAGIVAGSLYGLDLMVATLNFEAMSESLFVFLTTFALLIWLRLVVDTGPRLRLSTYAWVGGLLGVAILTRPAGLYLPVVFAALEACLAFVRARRRFMLAGPALLLLTSYGLLTPWIIRNYSLYGVPRLTTADNINLAYFSAAGVYQLKYGVDREKAEDIIVHEYGLVPLTKANNFWLADQDVRTADAKEHEVAVTILKAHPALFAKATAIGLAKAALSHSTSTLALMTARKWEPPSLDRILSGDFTGAERSLAQNDLGLVAVFGWQLMLTVGIWLLAAVGGVSALLDPRARLSAAALLAVAVYDAGTIAIVGLDAYWRHRMVLVPVACAFAGLAVAVLARRLRCAVWSYPGLTNPRFVDG
jgi:4-amino-4-deoxy-L-arabinose transferase-like glycosyltransferase